VEPDIRLELGHGSRGVVLFQLLDDGHLKMEAFPGMTADEVSSFTENAKIYVR
jgi:hypothetical protein